MPNQYIQLPRLLHRYLDKWFPSEVARCGVQITIPAFTYESGELAYPRLLGRFSVTSTKILSLLTKVKSAGYVLAISCEPSVGDVQRYVIAGSSDYVGPLYNGERLFIDNLHIEVWGTSTATSTAASSYKTSLTQTIDTRFGATETLPITPIATPAITLP